MKMPIDKEWFEKRAAAEGDLEIGAGGRRKTMTLNLTDEEIAELERLANPRRDAIRAEAFEEAARIADAAAQSAGAMKDRKAATSIGGTAVLTGYIFAETEAQSIARQIRALAATPSPQPNVAWDETAPTREFVETLKEEIERLRSELTRLRSDRQFIVGHNEGFELGIKQAAGVAYRACAETRHVALGDKARAAIMALATTEGSTDA